MKEKNELKFKRGDFVFYLPWSYPQVMGGDTMMYVLGFDTKKQRYKCFDLGIYDDSFKKILYCKEKELGLIPEDFGERDTEECRNYTNEEWFNELCYHAYECTGSDKMKEIRDATHTYSTFQEWLKMQKPHGKEVEQKRFRAGDMVLYLPWSNKDGRPERIMSIMSYNKVAHKYKCFDPEISGDEPRVCYCLDEELAKVPDDSKWKKDPRLLRPFQDEYFDEIYYPLYYYHDGKEVWLRRSYKGVIEDPEKMKNWAEIKENLRKSRKNEEEN